MAPHTWSHLGDTVSDATHHMYYRGQRIREAYYRGEKIWGRAERFLGIIVMRPPDKLHYPERRREALREIAVTQIPEKRTHNEGEEFDFSGSVVTAFYVDNTTEDITDNCVFVPFEESNPFAGLTSEGALPVINEPLDYTGIKVFALWSGGRMEDITDECEFYPSEGSLIDPSSILVGIVIEQLPSKVTYSSGEHLNYSGLVVKAVYADGHAIDVTSECSFAPLAGDMAGDNRVRMMKIAITKLPKKLVYSPDEPISYEGIEIRALYSNGLSLDVTSECIFNPSETVKEEGYE